MKHVLVGGKYSAKITARFGYSTTTLQLQYYNITTKKALESIIFSFMKHKDAHREKAP